MNDLFETSLNQWFHLENMAIKAEKAAKAREGDLSFYLQMLEVGLEQAEVAPLNKAEEAIEYCRNTAESARYAQADVNRLKEEAASARRKADLWKQGLRSVANC